jgi:GT2 family glycosyltransferase
MGNRHDKDYIEGWCIAATRDIWDKLGGWPDDLPGMYWEDNILCLKAERMGITLNKTNWYCWHANAYTSLKTPGALDHSEANEAYFRELQNAR